MSELKNLNFQSTRTNYVHIFQNDHLTRKEKILLTREIEALCLEVDFNKLLEQQQQLEEMRIYTEDLVKKSSKEETKNWQKLFLQTVTSIFKNEKFRDKELSKVVKNKLKSKSTSIRMGISRTQESKPLHPSLHKIECTQKKCKN